MIGPLSPPSGRFSDFDQSEIVSHMTFPSDLYYAQCFQRGALMTERQRGDRDCQVSQKSTTNLGIMEIRTLFRCALDSLDASLWLRLEPSPSCNCSGSLCPLWLQTITGRFWIWIIASLFCIPLLALVPSGPNIFFLKNHTQERQGCVLTMSSKQSIGSPVFLFF